MPTRKSPNDDENSATEEIPAETAEPTENPAEESAEPEAEQTNIVRYTGLVSERGMSREDWEKAGVSDQDGVVWTRDTGNVVPIDRFSEEALQALANSGEFEVIRDVKD